MTQRWLLGAAGLAVAASTFWLLGWLLGDYRVGDDEPTAAFSSQRLPIGEARGRATAFTPPDGSAGFQESVATDSRRVITGPPGDDVAGPSATAALQKETATYLFDTYGQQQVERLVEQGLAHDDAERIISRALDQLVGCYFDSLMQLAERFDADPDDVLYAFHATLLQADGPLLTEFFPRPELRAMDFRCASSAAQVAGIVAG